MRSANAKQWLQLLRFCFQPGACVLLRACDPWRIRCVTTRIKMSHVQHGNFQCHTDSTIYYTHSRSYTVLRHLSLGLPWIVLPAKVRTKAEAHARNVKEHILLEKMCENFFYVFQLVSVIIQYIDNELLPICRLSWTPELGEWMRWVRSEHAFLFEYKRSNLLSFMIWSHLLMTKRAIRDVIKTKSKPEKLHC